VGKIRVEDLARMMGSSTQDLVFKLKSIGVRVEGDDAQIDSDVLQAILQGKKLPHPREVILRDEEAPASPRPVRRMPTGRPAGPLRPRPRRTIIQRVEPRIKTIPTAPPERPAAPAAPSHGEAPAASTTRPAAAPAGATASPGASEARPVRGEARAEEVRPAKDDKKAKKAKKGRPDEAPEENLRVYEGKITDLEEVEAEAEVAPSRRRRRAQRRQEEAEEPGKVLPFRAVAAEGPITLSEGMTVRDFSEKLGVRSKDLIKLLFKRGLLANINDVLDPELAKTVAEEDLGIGAMVVSFEEEVQLQHEVTLPTARTEGKSPRAPVVTIMGHVDHGKTTLLDVIRSSKITESEFGGITQHIGAYQVQIGGRKIVFLDTPGHEAFTLMRARGAKVTDLVVLVVAADDGVMPQTVEAIDHARAAGVPIVVAINKMDKPDANPDRVKKELSDQGLTPEDWGGDTVVVPISAKKQEGIAGLLEMIALTADLLELKANPDLPAQGVVLEARKEVGRGIVASVLIQNGTLRAGDVFVAGSTWGRVRVLVDDMGQRIPEAEPATPVEVAGFGDLPDAGDLFQTVEEEAKARSIAEFRQQEQRKRELAPTKARLSLEQLFDQIQEGEVKELPVVLKADVQGSVEVLTDTLQKISTDKVKVQVIHAGVGAITTNDVLLASASEAIIFAFNVRPERNAAELAEKEKVDIRLHTVIYELADELRKAMTGLLEPVYREVQKGRAEVRDTFKIPKVGTVAGCHVVEGVIPRTAGARLLRDNRVVWEGKIASLRRFKDDVAEVRSGFDCGIGLERFQDVKPGDSIEAYVREEVAPTL
jgi:translation initiation factor IF-2